MGSNDRVSVVVTGLGATTPLGGDVTSTWSAMLAGTSGVQRITDSWGDPLPVKIAATTAVDPVAVVGGVQARKMDRCEQFALVAAREAWADAGSPEVDPYRLGVAVTSGIGGIGSTLTAYDALRDKGWERISPYTVPMLMPNGAAGWISIEFGAKAGAGPRGGGGAARGAGRGQPNRRSRGGPWSPWSTRWPGTPGSTRWRPAPGTPPMPTTSRSARRTAKA